MKPVTPTGLFSGVGRRIPPLRRSVVPVVSALLCGCFQTSKPAVEPEGAPLTKPEIQAFYEQAKDPRQFWLTVYDSDAGPVFKNDYRTHPNQHCILPFKSSGNSRVPVIQFQARGPTKFLAVIDTSSSEAWASFSVIPTLGLIPLNNPAYRLFPVHVNDTVPGLLCAGDRFRFDQLQLETPLVFARATRSSLGPLDRGQDVAQAALGTRVLKVFRTVQFDFPERQMLLATVNPYTPNPNRLAATVPFSLQLGSLTVKGTLDGAATRFIVDTAGAYGLALGTPPTEPVRRLQLGDLLFQDLTATAAGGLGLGMPDSPRIGLELLGDYKMTLDTEKRVIYFETPEA